MLISRKKTGLYIFINGLFSNRKLKLIFDYLCVPIYLLLIVKNFILYKIFENKKPCDDNNELIGICCIAKNESLYIKEWINYHICLFKGRCVFYIYDNDSDDKLYDILKVYISNKQVFYKKIKGKERQYDAYNHCLNKHKFDVRLIFFLDCDEFVSYKGCGDPYKYILCFFRKKYVGGVCFNWRIFGSNGLRKYDSRFVIQRFTMCSDDTFERNKNYKSVVDPLKVKVCVNPHFCYFYGKYNTINQSNELIKTVYNYNYAGNIRINHYYTKSKEEFIIKMKRGFADQVQLRKNDFDYNDRNDILNEDMLYFVNKI